MSVAPTLEARFREAVATECGLGPGAKVVVALSGGLDSCVLLHLAHFALEGELTLIVAHFDHGMRPESSGDAAWVAGLCRAWDLPARIDRAPTTPHSEAHAREARYDFLERVRALEDAVAVLVAHHADDQAETVLYRVLRGTGVRGLAAIPRRRSPGVVRPLLDFWREELEEYASRVGLSWREDASNAEVTFARNAIRGRLLPEAERLVAPEARRALVRLARLAAEDEAAWEAVLADLAGPLDVRVTDTRVSFDRDGFLAVGAALRPRLLRALLAPLRLELDASGTGRCVAFTSSGPSGKGIGLGGGVELRRELDRMVVELRVDSQEDRTLRIPDSGPGSGEAYLGGRLVPVSWGGRDVGGHECTERFEVGHDRFPLVVRAREPGDRIRLAAGTKKLKKVLLEARIPLEARAHVPVVVDAGGEVLWVPGVARAVKLDQPGNKTVLTIGIG